MFAEVITIGDELLIGQVIDTNSAWMGKELNKIGIEVLRITSVRDRSEEIIDAIDSSMKRVNLVLVTGGLGPTKDDITKQTLCDYFGTKLVFSEEVFENIQKVLSGRVRMNSLNRDQALVPETATIINNRVGSAPVTWFEQNGNVLISMPGVPEEMKTVMSEEVLPRLQNTFRTDYILHKTFMVKNTPESILAERLEEWETHLPGQIKLAYLPKAGLIRLRLTARGNNKESLLAVMGQEIIKLKYILGEDLYEDDDTPLEVSVGELLKSNKLTLSTAESCTGGKIAARLTSIPGSSAFFKGSVVAYDNEVKTSILNVQPSTLEKFGAVSEETVLEMAKGAMDSLKTDCTVAVSGIAGPDGGSAEKPVGTIWIAAGYKNKFITYKQETDRGRELNTERAVNNALILLFDLIKNRK